MGQLGGISKREMEEINTSPTSLRDSMFYKRGSGGQQALTLHQNRTSAMATHSPRRNTLMLVFGN
jgi:hypothetical protein